MLTHEIHRFFDSNPQRDRYKFFCAPLLIVKDLCCTDLDARLEKLIFTHPVVVIDLTEISRARIRNDDHHELFLTKSFGSSQGGVQGCSAATASKNTFKPGQLP